MIPIFALSLLPKKSNASVGTMYRERGSNLTQPELPRSLTITVGEVEEAPPHSLREWVPQFTMGKVNRKVFTTGYMLYRVRTEKLYEAWGYRTFWQYCRDEGKIRPTNSENWRIAYYVRYKALGFNHDDMQALQERGFTAKVLRRIQQTCHTREEALVALAEPHPARRLGKKVKKLGYEPYKLGHLALTYQPLEYETIHGVLDTLNRNFNLNERRGIFAAVLLCKVLLQTPIEKRYEELKRLCLFHGLNEGFVNAVLGEEKWKEIAKK